MSEESQDRRSFCTAFGLGESEVRSPIALWNTLRWLLLLSRIYTCCLTETSPIPSSITILVTRQHTLRGSTLLRHSYSHTHNQTDGFDSYKRSLADEAAQGGYGETPKQTAVGGLLNTTHKRTILQQRPRADDWD